MAGSLQVWVLLRACARGPPAVSAVGPARPGRRALPGYPDDGVVLHRHPFLSLVTLLYLGFVALVTLTPGNEQPDYAGLAGRVLARLERYPELEPVTSRLSVERVEFLANIGLFVPLGMFVLLLVGTRLWLVAFAVGIVLTSMIESVQREIPGRVSDPRDVAANSIGMFVGIAVAMVLTLPGTLRRRRERMRRVLAISVLARGRWVATAARPAPSRRSSSEEGRRE